jgi:hypothetical protein
MWKTCSAMDEARRAFDSHAIPPSICSVHGLFVNDIIDLTTQTMAKISTTLTMFQLLSDSGLIKKLSRLPTEKRPTLPLPLY